MNDLFESALAKEGITGDLAHLARSIYGQESGGGRNTKTSNAGAVGGMQIIPSTFRSMADQGWDIKNPEHNARAGIRYIQQLHASNGGDPSLTAVGYYGGPGAMAKAVNGEAVRDPRNPNAPDTFEYADQVVNRLPNAGEVKRLQRKGLEVTPVAPPVDTQPIPTDIPAYHGVPDEWSKFGRALAPAEPVTPQSLGYGNPAPIMQKPDPGFLQKYMPPVVQPTVAAFKKWLK